MLWKMSIYVASGNCYFQQQTMVSRICVTLKESHLLSSRFCVNHVERCVKAHENMNIDGQSHLKFPFSSYCHIHRVKLHVIDFVIFTLFERRHLSSAAVEQPPQPTQKTRPPLILLTYAFDYRFVSDMHQARIHAYKIHVNMLKVAQLE